MKIKKSQYMSKTIIIVGVVLSLSSVSSFAAVGQKAGTLYQDWSGNYISMGNSDARGTAYTRSYSHSRFDADEGTSTQNAISDFDVTAGIFKKTYKLLEMNSRATAYRRPGEWDSYSTATIKMKGKTVATYSHYQNNGWSKSTAKFNKEMTFFSGRYDYPVGIFTLTLKGNVGGAINVTAEGYQKYHKPSPKYYEDKGTATANGNAFLFSRNSVSAGIPWLAEGGVTISFELVDVANNTQSWTGRRHHYERPTSSQRQYWGGTWNNHNISLGGGSIKAWLKGVGIKLVNKTIVKWNGYQVAGRTWINKRYDEFFSS